MAAGWARGRFWYRHPEEMRHVANEVAYGYLAHYAIGVGLALPFVLAWDYLIGGLPPAEWSVAYGATTTLASFFLAYPAMGLGVFGRLSPERTKALITPLANHLFYGAGLALGIWLAALGGS